MSHRPLKTTRYSRRPSRRHLHPHLSKGNAHRTFPHGFTGRSLLRRYSSRRADNHRSPTAKRPHRSYSHSSSGSSRPSSPTNSSKAPCKAVSDNKDSYTPSDARLDDHGSSALAFDQQNYYPSYQHYDAPSSHLHQPYNPEAPDMKYDAHHRSSMYARQPLPPGQRTLVTVVTNAEPLPLEQKPRQGDSGNSPSSDPYWPWTTVSPRRSDASN